MNKYKILVVSAGISHIGLTAIVQYPEVDFGIKPKCDTLSSELKTLNNIQRKFPLKVNNIRRILWYKDFY